MTALEEAQVALNEAALDLLELAHAKTFTQDQTSEAIKVLLARAAAFKVLAEAR